MISRPLLIPVQRELHLNQLVNWHQLLEQKARYALTLVTQNMAQGPAANDNIRCFVRCTLRPHSRQTKSEAVLYKTLGLCRPTLT